MFSSEQKFTINGYKDKDLEKVLQLALNLCGRNDIKAFYEDVNGLVFCSYKCNKSTEYPFNATKPILIEQIKQYIKNLPNEEIVRLAGDKPNDYSSVILGWEVFIRYGLEKINLIDMNLQPFLLLDHVGLYMENKLNKIIKQRSKTWKIY